MTPRTTALLRRLAAHDVRVRLAELRLPAGDLDALRQECRYGPLMQTVNGVEQFLGLPLILDDSAPRLTVLVHPAQKLV